ncbi:Ser/Thr protein kinase RdoA (MazF antagonist) [Paenibacillus methanolicus]|uniref:Ser/Thr protein kinase RdoA (MazF antagonist) n=2 Tax=Paenibacillus methanolicus TaxID=582686 RepID=A0A5S5C7T5_9BACL|nr:Ser/Thr protein kinase RdoA (MazF antagonist) [Paenibacillus methanolicus]
MLGPRIAEGSSCEVYEWGGPDKIVKLFYADTPPQAVELEYGNNNAVWECGLPVARPYERVNWEGRDGIVFERVAGDTLVSRLFARLNAMEPIDAELRLLADVLHRIHRTSPPGIVTDQKANLKGIIARPPSLTPDETAALHAYLDRLPAKRQLCQGDANPNNLLIRDVDGEAVMIDWMHASLGNPAADVAEVCVMLEYAVLPPEMPEEAKRFFEESREAAYRLFIDEYCRSSGMTEAEIRDWYVPLAARAIASGAIPEEQTARLAALIRERLHAEKIEE